MWVRFILISAAIFLSGGLDAQGFRAGTQVKVPCGYASIEQLAVGDEVVCYDRKHGYVTRVVQYLKSELVQGYVLLLVDKERLYLSHNQKVYLADANRWLAARYVRATDKLLGSNGIPVQVDAVSSIEKNALMYDLSVGEEPHSFCVSSCDIVVHNFFPAVVITFGITFGSGAIEFTGITVGLAALGGYVGFNAFKKKKKKIALVCTKPALVCASPSPRGPDDEDKKHPHGKYEDAPYHHKNSKGGKSSCPKNGQKALDNSFEYSAESNGRVSLCDDEFVVLSRTSRGVYHGHVRSWWELSESMQNVLKKAGLVTHKGKMLI